jgi:hypothetical protein
MIPSSPTVSYYNAELDNDNQSMAFRMTLPRRRQKKLVLLLVIEFYLPRYSLIIYHCCPVKKALFVLSTNHLPKQTFEAFISDFSIETTLDWLVRKSNAIFNVVKDFLPIHLLTPCHNGLYLSVPHHLRYYKYNKSQLNIK